MDLHPAGERVRIGEVRLQRREVEIALVRVGVVAIEAVLGEEGMGVRAATAIGATAGSPPVSDRRRMRNHARSSPRMVLLPVENSLVSMPRRWSIET